MTSAGSLNSIPNQSDSSFLFDERGDTFKNVFLVGDESSGVEVPEDALLDEFESSLTFLL